ncbi:MAG: DNA topoisomerase [Epulopiscium sp.]|nr:DNA topoisomerase [Candidatus Epulonipiscium sp.]
MTDSGYDNESISTLQGAERVRLRPSVIFGSDGIDGSQHAVFEILANSIDETREGYGDKIEVTLHKDHSITIKDYGRGVPLDYNENEQRYNWELVFCELYAGGKYDNNSGDNYEFSLGLNGLGACATQYSSEFMNVEVQRDGYLYELTFKEGENIGGLKKTKVTSQITGTKIHWKPDSKVFTDVNIPVEFFHDTLKRQAVVNEGVVFEFYDEINDETIRYEYDNGLVDYIEETAKGKNFTEVTSFDHEATGRDSKTRPEYRLKFQVAFCFCNEEPLIEYYHNSSFLEYGGSPDKAIRNAMVYSIDQYIKGEDLYNKNEKRITFTDIEDSMILIINSFSTITSYENQTKKAINNKFIQDEMTRYLRKVLPIYLIENKDEADKIARQILVNKRSREKAERTRVNIRKKLTGTIDLSNRVKKFVDCRSKDNSKRELYIVEGDSALGACKLGRDAEFQGIMPVRGKILNCLKSDYDRIFKSDIIVDLLKVLGCGVEIKSKHNKDFNTFDIDKLKWDKVIICTDADVDGYQIRTLILTMLYTLVPTLIEEGKVYIAETPLYEITSKTETFFAYTEAEKAEYISKIKGPYSLQRSKGLGENNPDMMWQTTMSPDTRRLIQVLPEDAQATKEMFDLLLGDNLDGRKEFIASEGHRYIDQTDVV